MDALGRESPKEPFLEKGGKRETLTTFRISKEREISSSVCVVVDKIFLSFPFRNFRKTFSLPPR